MTNGAASSLKFYCPTHQIRFQAVGQTVIACEQGGHQLGSGFPKASWWEFCCDCGTFWPVDPSNGHLQRSDCLVCERLIAWRYVCSVCQVVSRESSSLVRRKNYFIDSSQGINPNCPGCAQVNTRVMTHNCAEAACEFVTARPTCPFCDTRVAQASTRSTAPAPVRVCPFCRTEQSAGNKFCKKCGKPSGNERTSQTDGARKIAEIAAAQRKAERELRNQAQAIAIRQVEENRVRLEAEVRARAEAEAQGLEDSRRRFAENQQRNADQNQICLSEENERDEAGIQHDHPGCVADVPYELPAWSPEITTDVEPTESSQPTVVDTYQGVARDNLAPAIASDDDHKSVLDDTDALELKEHLEESLARATHSDIQPEARIEDDTQYPTPITELGSNGTETAQYQPSWYSAPPTYPLKKRFHWLVIGLAAAGCLIVATILVMALRSDRLSVRTSPEPAPQKNPVAPSGMVLIQGGEFVMGNDTGVDEFEKPAHRVTVESFYLDVTEVTCAEYEKFVKAANYPAPPTWLNGACPPGKAKKAVTEVDWYDANAYAQWAQKRLPTEQEWEFAARGATGWKYPWGNDWRTGAANAGDSSTGEFADVGAYPLGKSPFGIMDMIGNAWEWTTTEWQGYPGGPAPTDASSRLRVIRGGYWGSSTPKATTTFRRGWDARGALEGYQNTGFRCAANVKPQNENK
jgi:formylglycine-generating enzyme required for sulfatase activity